jgi:hypothetical protein
VSTEQRTQTDYMAHARHLQRENPKASTNVLAGMFYDTASKAMWRAISLEIMEKVVARATVVREHGRSKPALDQRKKALVEEVVKKLDLYDMRIPWAANKPLRTCTPRELVPFGKFARTLAKEIGLDTVIETKRSREQINALGDKLHVRDL